MTRAALSGAEIGTVGVESDGPDIAVSVSVVACTAELSVESSGTDSLSQFNEVGVISDVEVFSVEHS